MANKLIKSGPFGRECPPDWNFVLGPCETIKQVIIHGGFIVDGIGFVIADECGKVTTKFFGGQGGNRYEITLKPDEFMTHISGTYGVYSYSSQVQIATIKIHTNCCPNGYGPYGKGMSVSKVCSFSSTRQQGGRLVGFFGSGSKYLGSIGVYIDEDNFKKSGPWGSQYPTNWDLKLGRDETIKQVNIRAGFIVDGIGFVNADKSCKITNECYFGGNGGNYYTVTLKPNEIINHISGTYGLYKYTNQLQIATIKIHTNYCPGGYGPFGEETDVSNVQSFSTASPCHVVAGFFGRASQYLESIGAYMKPLKDNIEKSGPWGSQSPTNWELKFGRDETIKQVNIRAGFIVDGIGFVIADKSCKITNTYFGGNGGNYYTVKLKPNEIINHISGTYGLYKYTNQLQIATIKIHTNCCPCGYGPFGEETDVSNVQSFSTAIPCHVAAGFFGRASQYLESIGAYMKPLKC